MAGTELGNCLLYTSIRAEIYLGWGILMADAFSIIKESTTASGSGGQ